ncbi:unnamed protein product [Bursaphelenchus xylophilus]|uniref:(pine wood nematode) hypothetical protein n=1 Tax=Bursaphelenchus xylophilus TaxID=6326 RepID=A0A7I8WQ27_BURXY|nr:unnamed protein product [Bursaphelenchus xylophilus]CAG9096129.1 unnamed protein product [Bursaphelenchus xylophilus]
MPKSSLVNEGHSRKCQNTRDFDCPERQRKPRRISRGTHHGLDAVDSELEYDSEYSSGCDGMHAIRQCESGREEIPPVKLCVGLNDMEIALELDTGAARTVIPERVWRQIGRPEITRYTGILQEYGGSPLEVIGAVRVKASFRGHQEMTEIIVVRRHDCQPTLGRELKLEALLLRVRQLCPLDLGTIRKGISLWQEDTRMEPNASVEGMCRWKFRSSMEASSRSSPESQAIQNPGKHACSFDGCGSAKPCPT